MMNKYQEALDAICRYVSDQRHGIARYTEREICECLGTLGEMEKKFAQYQKALDVAIELLDRNMLCEKCPFPHDVERCTVNGCREYMKECLLKDE